MLSLAAAIGARYYSYGRKDSWLVRLVPALPRGFYFERQATKSFVTIMVFLNVSAVQYIQSSVFKKVR